jgi:hypothetical protein
VSSTVRCSRAGKYEAKRLQNLLRLIRSDRRDNVPDVASLLKMREYMRYGMRSGHASGMAQRRRKRERKMGIDTVCQSTASVCKRRCTGTFRGAHRMLCKAVESVNGTEERKLAESILAVESWICTYADRSQPAPARRPLAKCDLSPFLLAIRVVLALFFSRGTVCRSCSGLFS